MMNFVLKTKNCVLKTRNCVFKMMSFAGGSGGPVLYRSNDGTEWTVGSSECATDCSDSGDYYLSSPYGSCPASPAAADCVGTWEEVAICIKIDGFCIKNDGFCIKNDEILTQTSRSTASLRSISTLL